MTIELNRIYKFKSQAELKEIIREANIKCPNTYRDEYIEFTKTLNRVVKVYNISGGPDGTASIRGISEERGQGYGYVVYDEFFEKEITEESNPEYFL